jgi:hypothetical protein
MKSASLFHLMQIRARKFEERANEKCRRDLRAVQKQLKIEHSRGWFELKWQFDDRDFSLNVPDKDFAFHVAGDTATAVAQRRGGATNLRETNWQQAALLWRRVAEVSGFVISDDLLRGDLGLTPELTLPDESCRLRIIVILAMIGANAITGMFSSGPFPAATNSLVLALLFALTMSLEETHLHEQMTVLEIVIIGIGALLPLWLNGDTLWLLPLLAGLVGTCWLERTERKFPPLWFAAGLLLGLPTMWSGWLGAVPALIMASSLCVLAFVSPYRLSFRSELAGLLGAALGMMVGTSVPIGKIVTEATVLQPDNIIIACVVPAALFIVFTSWWVHGTLFQVTPWLAMGVLTLATAIPILQGATATMNGNLILS